MKKHNFSSGPAILPQEVMQQAAAAVLDFNGMGLSILEISHRSKPFVEVLDEARQGVKDALKIGDTHEVLFLTGGASSQFYMTAMNLLSSNETAAFIDTGVWSAKAIKEAQHFGKVEVIASSKEAGYTFIPKEFTVPKEAKYLHITTNNTIYGTQYQTIPTVDVPLVADMSSDIFSRPIDVERYGLIYAGAQKNLGPAGVTIVIVRKDWLGKVDRTLPTMLDYQTHIKKESSFNTPPVFPIYVCMLTLRWLKAQGGVEAMVAKSQAKAKLVYDAIDRNPCFEGKVVKADRSLMNLTFIAKEKEYEMPFLEWCNEADISGIKGHRSAGGFRASIYNAMPMSSVEALVEVLDAFGEKYG